MPGWSALVDGKSSQVGGTTWIEVDIPNGEHQVELQYTPPGFKLGLILAILALLKLVIESVLPILRSSKTQLSPMS